MSIENSGVRPGGPGGAVPVPGGQQPRPRQNTVAQEEADAFDSALDADHAEAGAEETALTPEQALIDMMKKNSVKQFMNRSQEQVQETKKNLEG